MKILANLKGKILITLIIILTTLLAATYIDRGIITNDRDKTKSALATQLIVNERLVSENKKLKNDQKSVPNESVVIVKESVKEICNSKISGELIKNLPSKPKEVVGEETIAGTDDRLPDDIKRLLK